MGSTIRLLSMIACTGVAAAQAAAARSRVVTIAVEAPFHDWLPETRNWIAAARLAIEERGGSVCDGWTVNVSPRDHGSPVFFVNHDRMRGNAQRDAADRTVGAILGPYVVLGVPDAPDHQPGAAAHPRTPRPA